MSEKNQTGNIVLKICLAILLMIIAIAVCLIVVSGNDDEISSESTLISSESDSSSMNFVPESSYEINLKVGQICDAELTDFETDSKLIWLSSDDSIASVDDFGAITAVSAGTCTITVVIMDIDQSIAVTVNVSE